MVYKQLQSTVDTYFTYLIIKGTIWTLVLLNLFTLYIQAPKLSIKSLIQYSVCLLSLAQAVVIWLLHENIKPSKNQPQATCGF